MENRKCLGPESQKQPSLLDYILNAFILFILFYIIISSFSIMAIAMGQEDIPYMPFWHAPWKWLFDLLK